MRVAGQPRLPHSAKGTPREKGKQSCHIRGLRTQPWRGPALLTPMASSNKAEYRCLCLHAGLCSPLRNLPLLAP